MADGGAPGSFAAYEEASAATLAEQPVTEPKVPKTLGRELAFWSLLFSHLESRLGAMRSWRYSWWTYWAKLAEFILPRRYKWLVTANTMDRGFPINGAIIDGTPTQAMQTCSAGLLSGLMNPMRPWAILETLPGVEVDEEGKAFLELAQERMYVVLAQSNFYQMMAQFFQDITTFGTAVLIIYEDMEDVIRCYLPCTGEYYLSASARLSVDTMYREFTYTISQIVDWFQVESCPEQVQKAWREGGASLENEMVVCHSLEPNFALSDKKGGKVSPVPGGYTFRETYWLKGIKTKQPLSLKGFHERPHVIGRWSTVSNDPYGRSPGMDALGDIMQLQQETRRKGEFIDKLVRPPMGASPELKNEPASINPGQITYTDTSGQKKGFWPLFEVQAAALAPMVADLEKIEKRIQDYFYTDVFMMISQMEGIQPRNELEIAERKGEKIQRLGPMINNFETEVAGPAVRRILNIMERRRMLPPRPKSLQGKTIELRYVSILKLALLASQTTSIEQGMAFMGRLSEASKAAGRPDPLRIIKMDDVGRTYLDHIAFPAKLVASEKEVSANDQAAAKSAQQAGEVHAGMAAVNAAKTLSETNVGGANALTALLGAPK